MVNIYDPNDDAPEGAQGAGYGCMVLLIFAVLAIMLVAGVWLTSEGVVW